MDNYFEYEKQIKAYVKENIGRMLKEPRSFIRYPFMDPGSVYDGNVWDWDTYQKHKDGVLMNMHKPFLCQQIRLISDDTGDYSWAAGFLPGLETYFARYDADYFLADKGLYVWCDDIMIGLDNDPASFGRPKYSTANIFLNSFMVMELEAYITIKKMLTGKEDKAIKAQKASLEAAIQRECWDTRDEFFYSVDVDIQTRAFDWFHQGLGVFWKTLPIRIRTWSGFLPLLAGFATEEQAKKLRMGIVMHCH